MRVIQIKSFSFFVILRCVYIICKLKMKTLCSATNSTFRKVKTFRFAPVVFVLRAAILRSVLGGLIFKRFQKQRDAAKKVTKQMTARFNVINFSF